jgi:hypothetical protein
MHACQTCFGVVKSVTIDVPAYLKVENDANVNEFDALFDFFRVLVRLLIYRAYYYDVPDKGSKVNSSGNYYPNDYGRSAPQLSLLSFRERHD